MKILNINKYYQHTGGGDRFFFDMANILLSKGHEVIPYCLDYHNNYETPYASYFPKGVSGTDIRKQTLTRKIKLFLNGIYSFEAKAGLARLLSDVTPDIAHLHILHYSMSPSVIDCLNCKNIPIIFSLHDFRIVCAGAYLYSQGHQCKMCIGGRYYNAVRYRCEQNSRSRSLMGTIGNYLYRFIKIYNKIDIFTVPHNSMLELIIEFGIPRHKVRVLRNPLTLREKLPSPSVGHHVTFFGNLSPQKGIFTLLKAAANLSDIPFIICGKGEAIDEVKAFIDQNKIKNIQIDTVMRWHSGLKNIISSSRLVVSTSEWSTPLEYSTLETMVLGKAIVASRIGGNSEVVEDGVTGIFFEPGNSLDLEKAIKYLYSRPDLCEQMGAEAHKRILRDFTEDAFYKDIIDIYEDAKELRQNRA